MGGGLAVTSQPGAGSVFTLSLPRPVGEPTRTAVTSAMPLMPQVSIGTVLYSRHRRQGCQPKKPWLTTL